MWMAWNDFRLMIAQALLGVILCTVLPAAQAQAEAERRVALVIGNGSYRSVPALDNPVTDAKAVAASLKRIGFEVIEGYDLATANMRLILARFSAALPDSKAAMVYYAGHGVSVEDENYLIPVDLSLKTQTDLDLNAISLSLVLKQMRREERVNVVILDACRDNPFAAELARSLRNRSAVAERGLSRVDTDLAKGTLIAFATDPRSTALDGRPGENSPFTKALLRHMEEPNISIDTVMSRVRADVWDETKQHQMPWVNTSIIGEFILHPVVAPTQQVAALTPVTTVDTGASTAAPVASDRIALENKLWDSAEHGNSADDYRAYLDAYPNGIYAQMARSRVARMSAAATVTASAPAGNPASTAVPRVAGAATVASLTETTRAKGPAGPATPHVSDALRNEVTSADTEKAMHLKLAARRQVQERLVALGLDAGEPNGTFGPKTRTAIADWQSRNGLQATTWLAPLQWKFLLDQSEDAWKRIAMLHPAPAPATATRQITSAHRQPAAPRPARTVRIRTRSNGAGEGESSGSVAQPAPFNNSVGAFIGGIAVGGALGLLHR